MSIRDALDALNDAIRNVEEAESAPVQAIPNLFDQILMELRDAKYNAELIASKSNVFEPEGRWTETQPGYFHYDTRGTGPVSLFGLDFHVIGIQITNGETQKTSGSANEDEFSALCIAGGTSKGFSTIEIGGKPVVVYLVPFDR